ncbi:mitogen-activated protein kinase kinase kinase 14 [Garra rufa]|uniref:mitogen-activated protein kinase kinase kinase 14 n=1 Tax=Garra rufa TaxID=137080 RepID=UPI003CCE5540
MSKKDKSRIRRNAPAISQQKINSSSRCCKPSIEDPNKTPEHLSKPQQVSLDVHLDVGVSRLCLHKLEVDFPSTFESRSLISDGLVTNLDSDLAYIYAESIKGCDSTCCTSPGDCNTHDPLVESTEQDSEFDSSDGESKDSSDWELYMSACSIAATAGSRLSADNFGSLLKDFDSSCIYTDWERRASKTETDLGYSPAEAEWGSVSSGSESSCYAADRDSYCTTDRLTSSSESDSCRSEAVGDIKCPDGCPEGFLPGFEGCFDSCDVVEDVCRGKESDSRRDAGELWGLVTQTDRRHFSECFCEMIKKGTKEKDVEKINVNEGFLFHPKQFLQMKNSEYREGREYSFLRHIQNGSYGDVFCIRDKQTGFTCAAKKIPLCSFRWEEVETWSRMESPHVLQLYGAVREGPNVILFMDLKRGSLAQLLRVKGHLSEELALYYHSQVLQALQHLHSRHVVHLDVKVDNVLLSEDGRQCFLCDFGLSETLNQGGYSTKTFRGNILRGTESHMPPEVARGDPRSAKADVWSSCCMLLHMLNGHQPWTRYYPHPLYLKIVSEPPPLWEIPPDCDPLTCDVIKGGLVKEPRERHSASELLQKTVKALRTVCGLSSPEDSAKHHSAPAFEDCPKVISHETAVLSITQTPTKTEDLSAPTIHWVSTWRQTAPNEDDSDSTAEESVCDEDARFSKLKRDETSSWMNRYWGEEEDNEEDARALESEEDTSEINENVNVTDQTEAGEGKTDYFTEKRVLFGGCGEYDRSLLEESESWDGETRSVVDDEEVESDLESLRELGSDWPQEWEPFLQLQTLYHLKEEQMQSEDSYSESEEESVMLRKSEQHGTSLPDSHRPQPLTWTSRCDSEQDLSDEDPDDLSSGVFSSCSTVDVQSFNVDWSVSTDQTPSCYFEGLGVDIWVEDVSGESLKIRERPQVKIGHIAVGISEQISLRTFSLATLDGHLVSPDTEVCESGMWLQCVPAPDGSPTWEWRVRDGKLELQEYDEHSDVCSTVAL